MKKVRKSLAIIFALAMLFTNGTVQCAFAGSDSAVPKTEKDIATYVYKHDDIHPYQYRSPHRYSYEYNGTENNNHAPAIYRMLKTDDNNSVSLGYCCDLRTSVKEGSYYKRANLEDAGYYNDDHAKHIRLILKKGYWREAGESATATDLLVLADAAATANNLDDTNKALLNNLTSAEALAATQYAIWHYANYSDGITDNINIKGINNFKIYTTSQNANQKNNVKDTNSVDVADGIPTWVGNGQYSNDKSEKRIEWVYNYLIGLNPNDAAYSNLVQPASVISGFDQEYSNIQVVPNATNEKGAVTYNVNVTFKLNGSLDNNDKLQVVAKPVMKKNAKSTIDAQSITLDSKTKSEDGTYTVIFADLTAAQVKAIDKIEFTLDGEQYVANEVYFYEPFGGRDAAQSFVGFGSGKTKVHQTWTMNISNSETNQIEEKNVELIKYDEDSAVKAKDAEHAKELEAAGMVKVNDEGNGTYIDRNKVITVVGAKFQLYAKVNESDTEIPVGEPVTTDDNGKATWSVLVSGNDVTYYCKEIKAPSGYKLPDGNVTLDLSSKEARVYVPNCHDTGSIIISKTVESNADSNIDTTQHFNFKVEVDFSEATLVKECKKSEIDKDITHYSTVWSGTTEKCEKASHTNLAWVQDTDKEGKTTDKWATNITLAHGESLTINDLPVGTECTVTELDADGKTIKNNDTFIYGNSVYVTTNATKTILVTSDTTGTADDNNADANKNVINLVNNKVKDDAISFTVNKTDLDGNELAGSEITIFKYNNETGETGAVVDTWSSKVGETYDLGSKLTAGETYLLRETNAPDGYGYIEDVIFSVNKDGSIKFIENSLPTMKSENDDSVQVMGLDNEVSNITNNNSNDNIYLVKDGQTEITVKKLDQNNNPVVGAKLAILDENREPVLTSDGTAIEWTTDGKDKDITGLLIAGETYILTELEAPEGYQKAEDIEFTVPQLNGESKTVTMTDVKFGMGGVDKDSNGNNSDNDNTISTGDRTNMGLCLMLMTAAMVAGLGALTFRRKA